MNPTIFNALDAQVAAAGGTDVLVERITRQLAQAPAHPKNMDKLSNMVNLICAKDLTPESVQWVWNHWLAKGKLHILAGPPGVGKTTLAVSLAATVASGGRWPDGSPCAAGNVLIWSGEDGIPDTLLPRLLAAKADPSRIYFVHGSRVDGDSVPFDPARDIVQLAAEAHRIGEVRLLIVDPVVSAVAGDSHKNTEVRRSLQPLVDLAAELGCAVVGISHFTKGSGGRDPVERVTGSIAFGAVARVVMVAAKAQSVDGNESRVFARAKSNLGPDDGGFRYELEQRAVPGHPDITASVVAWGSKVAGNARELLVDPESDDDNSARGAAEAFLRELLKDGPVSTPIVQAEAKSAGHSWATVRRASEKMGVIKSKGVDHWYWQLATFPRGQRDQGAQLDQGAHSREVSTLASSLTDAEAF